MQAKNKLLASPEFKPVALQQKSLNLPQLVAPEVDNFIYRQSQKCHQNGDIFFSVWV